MGKKVEIILGYVDKPIGVGVAGTSLVDQYNSDKRGFALVNQAAQAGAAVAGVTSIVKLTAGFTPFLNIKTNLLAGTTVFLKITAEYRNHGTFQVGDVISLVGNVAGVLGSVTILAGASSLSVPLTAIGVGAGVAGIITSDVARNVYQSLVKPVWEKHLRANSNVVYPQYWIAPDLKLVSLAQIKAKYKSRIAVTRWNPVSKAVVLASDEVVHYVDTRASSGGAGYVEVDSLPMIFPLPISRGWNIDIGPFEHPGLQWSFGGIDRYH
jgi:hypothetical protein